MARIVILGAGLGGAIMAFEMKDKLRPTDELVVVNDGPTYAFVPSNPWVAVGWRERQDIVVDLAQVFARRGITLRPEGAARLRPRSHPPPRHHRDGEHARTGQPSRYRGH